MTQQQETRAAEEQANSLLNKRLAIRNSHITGGEWITGYGVGCEIDKVLPLYSPKCLEQTGRKAHSESSQASWCSMERARHKRVFCWGVCVRWLLGSDMVGDALLHTVSGKQF